MAQTEGLNLVLLTGLSLGMMLHAHKWSLEKQQQQQLEALVRELQQQEAKEPFK